MQGRPVRETLSNFVSNFVNLCWRCRLGLSFVRHLGLAAKELVIISLLSIGIAQDMNGEGEDMRIRCGPSGRFVEEYLHCEILLMVDMEFDG
jgi:hypothetical protein